VPVEQVGDGVAAEVAAGPAREERVAGGGVPVGDPRAEQPRGRLRQRGDPLLAALSCAAQVRACVEVGVRAGQRGQLGDAQPGLDGGQEEQVITAAEGRALVGGGEQRVGLGAGQE